jgi:dolichyl-phosphate-mannose--protein O-mannosyl transferase
MKRFFSKLPLELILLIIGAAITRLTDISYPNATVFDEVYYKSYAASYFNHSYYFDVHPPLAKLLLAGWAWLTGMHPIAGDTFASPATALRIFVACIGICIIPLIYGILRRLTQSRLVAGLGGLFAMLDGALIVESRFVLIDEFILCFGLAAVYCALRWREKYSWQWFVGAGLFAGAAASVKWTGLTALFLVLLIFAKECYEHIPSIHKRVGGTLLLFALGLTVYTGAFWVHFDLLTHTGPGDAFMSTQFQETIIGNPSYNPDVHMSFFDKFIEMNHEMYEVNATFNETHPYSSKWYTWPVEKRPIYYWEGKVNPNGTQGNIYLFGDPLIWWLSSLSVVAAIIIIFVSRLRKRFEQATPALSFLVVGYLVNWLPFMKIARIMFLYHYLFGLVYSMMILATIAGLVVPNNHQKWFHNPRYISAIALVIIAVCGFAYFSPLTYGIPISAQHLQDLDWLSSWR